MQRSVLFLSALILVSSYLPGQQSLNTSIVLNWDDNTLPDAFYGSYNEVWGYTDCDGEEYAMLGSSAYVHFFALNDIFDFAEIDRFEGGDVTVWRDIKSYQDHVYTVCDGCSEGMMIFDMSNLPNEVIKVDQTTEFFDNCHNLFIDEQHGRIYAAGTNTGSFGLIVLDIATDPDNPQLLANINLPGGYIHDLYVRDHIVYANSANNGLFVYDMTDPGNPVVLGTMTDYEEQGYNHSGWLTDDGQYLVMLDETHGTGVKMVNVSDPDDIFVEDIFRSTLLAPDFTNSVGHNPYVRGDYAFISYYHDGIQVFDLSDPSDVQRVAYYDTETDNSNYNSYTGNWGLYPFLPSGLILASDMKNGLFIVSMDSLDLAPTTPAATPDVELAFYDTTACTGNSVDLVATGEAESWEWMVSDAPVPNSDNPVYTVTEAGQYSVLATNGHCSILTDEVFVDFVNPVIPEVTEIDGVLSTSPAVSYQWYLDGEIITGAIEMMFSPLTEGLYQVETIDANGCVSISEGFFYETTGTSSRFSEDAVEVFPNPATDMVQLMWSGSEAATVKWSLLDATGRSFRSGIWNTGEVLQLPVTGLSAGMYVIELRHSTGRIAKRLIIQ